MKTSPFVLVCGLLLATACSTTSEPTGEGSEALCSLLDPSCSSYPPVPSQCSQIHTTCSAAPTKWITSNATESYLQSVGCLTPVQYSSGAIPRDLPQNMTVTFCPGVTLTEIPAHVPGTYLPDNFKPQRIDFCDACLGPTPTTKLGPAGTYVAWLRYRYADLNPTCTASVDSTVYEPAALQGLGCSTPLRYKIDTRQYGFAACPKGSALDSVTFPPTGSFERERVYAAPMFADHCIPPAPVGQEWVFFFPMAGDGPSCPNACSFPGI